MLKGSIITKNNISDHFHIQNKEKHIIPSITPQDEDNHIIDFSLPQTQLESSPIKVDENEKSYNYMMDEELDLRPSSLKNGQTYIVFYHVNLTGLKPFLEFKLYNNHDNDNLDLLEINIENQNIPMFDDFEYSGLYTFDNKQYLFYKFNKTTEINEITSKQTEFWCIIDDIINLKKFYKFVIGNNIYYFFINNLYTIYLRDDKHNIIETPITAYRGEYYRKVGLIAGLGVPRSSVRASMGPYFYYGSYDRQLKYAAITNDAKPKEVNGEKITIKDTPIYTKGGMVKFALFMGTSKVMFNLDNDPEDKSQISLEMAKTRNFIKSTLKIRDTDGLWTKDFNSVIQPSKFIYDKDLDINRKLDASFIIQYFNQQLAVNYAFFKTSHIKKDPKTTYYKVEDLILL